MGKISVDTFAQSKQYVNVRLQQGVPIVDADWNEMDDIRKHEHQTFLRAFVGNGVPQGSNSFQIQTTNLENDFQILGNTPEQPGLCLVDGWEIQINETVNYTAQRLYGHNDLADAWEVAHLEPLTTPGTTRIDTVYLDAWERLVDSTEDPDLLNPLIGIETCLRRKREWVVRVAEGTPIPEPPAEGHVYYPLARLTRSANQVIISTEQITDLRTSIATVRQNDVEQIAIDAFGTNYTLDKDGQPNLKISLREAINALLRGTNPTTSVTTLTTATFDPPTADYIISDLISFTDSQKITWIFWCVNGYDPNKNISKTSLWYKRYDPNTRQWENAQELSKVENASSYELNVLEDRQGNIWLFWTSYRNINNQWNYYIYYQHYVRTMKKWEIEQPLTQENTNNYFPVAINDLAGNIWVFWHFNRGTNDDIYYRCYTNTWESERQLTTATEDDHYPTATVHRFQNSTYIYVFWQSQRKTGEVQNMDIYYKSCYTDSDPPQCSSESYFTIDEAPDEHPLAFTTSRGEKWVFWLSYRTGSFDIWYRRNFGNEIQLNTGTGYVNWNYRVIEDSHGDIWVFWQSNSGLYYKHYNGTWGFTTQLTADHFDYFSITESHTSDIWTFRVQNNRDIQYQQLVAAI